MNEVFYKRALNSQKLHIINVSGSSVFSVIKLQNITCCCFQGLIRLKMCFCGIIMKAVNWAIPSFTQSSSYFGITRTFAK